jgi:hypothetical protein
MLDWKPLYVNNIYEICRGEYALITYHCPDTDIVQGIRFSLIFQQQDDYELAYTRVIVYMKLYNQIQGRLDYPMPTIGCILMDKVETDNENTLDAVDLDTDGICLGVFENIQEAREFVYCKCREVNWQREETYECEKYAREHTFI